jgi:hypothetical protein
MKIPRSKLLGIKPRLRIKEMASILGIPYKTVQKRLERKGIKPLITEDIFPESALEAIRNVSGKGRPPKAKPEE